MSSSTTTHQHLLLQQIAKNHEKAFKQLFELYEVRLYTYILGIIKSKEVAEELVIDVFLKIWQIKDTLSQIEDFDAFLFRIAHNKSVDFLRRASKDPSFRESLWNSMQVEGGVEADQQVIVREYENKLREAILQLSPQRRRVFLMSRENGFSHIHIAQKLTLSKHTVNNHIVESQRFIKDYLARHLGISSILLILFFSWM